MSKEMNKVFNVGTYAFNIKVELNAINEKKMITNYSKAEQRTSSPTCIKPNVSCRFLSNDKSQK
jgi:hypothetical protein